MRLAILERLKRSGRRTSLAQPPPSTNLRLHRRRRGLGRLRDRQPAVGGPRGSRCAGRSRTVGPAFPVNLKTTLPVGNIFCCRTIATTGSTSSAATPASTVVRSLVRAGGCSAAAPRSTARSTCAATVSTTTNGPRSAMTAGVTPTCCPPSSGTRTTPARHRPITAAAASSTCSGLRDPQPAGAGLRRRRGRGRPRTQRRLQRCRAGRLRPVRAEPAPRRAPEQLARLPASGARAAQPHGVRRGAGRADPAVAGSAPSG